MAYASTPEPLLENLSDWLAGDDARLLERHHSERRGVLAAAEVEVR